MHDLNNSVVESEVSGPVRVIQEGSPSLGQTASVISLSRATLNSIAPQLNPLTLEAATRTPPLIPVIHPVLQGDKVVMVHAGASLLFRALIAPTFAHAMEVQENAGEAVDSLGIDVISYTRNGIADVKALNQQDGLYIVKEVKSDRKVYRTIDAVANAYSMVEDPETCINRYTNPDVSCFSLTIKIENYPISKESKKFHDPAHVALDLDNQNIRHDLNNPENPTTVFGTMFLALKRRMENNLAAVTLLSFENMPGNGTVTKRLLLDFAHHSKAGSQALYDWINENVQAPNLMVDCITRESTSEDRDDLADDYGFSDHMLTVAEPFRFLVIEKFDGPLNDALKRVPWVRIVDSVDDYEKMKLLGLNAPHRGAVAYPGLVAGHTHVHHVMEDENLRRFFDDYMQESIAPLVETGLTSDEINKYTRSVSKRFSNTNLEDPLGRIGRDGIDKIFDRITRPIEYSIKNGKPYGSLLVGLASWISFLEGKDDKGVAFLDAAGCPVKKNGAAVYDDKGNRVGALDKKAEAAGLRHVVASIHQKWRSEGHIDLAPLMKHEAVKDTIFNGLGSNPIFIKNLTAVVEGIFAYGVIDTVNSMLRAKGTKIDPIAQLLTRENGVVRS